MLGLPQVVRSLRKKTEEAQQKEAAQLQENLGRVEQRAQQRVHQVLEYEQEVNAGGLLRPHVYLCWALRPGPGAPALLGMAQLGLELLVAFSCLCSLEARCFSTPGPPDVSGEGALGCGACTSRVTHV